jgi:hypothetical protein
MYNIDYYRDKNDNNNDNNIDWFIFYQDIHTLNLSEFQYTNTNITGLTMLDPKGQDIGYTTREWVSGKPYSVVKKVIPVSINMKLN